MWNVQAHRFKEDPNICCCLLPLSNTWFEYYQKDPHLRPKQMSVKNKYKKLNPTFSWSFFHLFRSCTFFFFLQPQKFKFALNFCVEDYATV